MLQVMAADENGCTRRLGILADDMFQLVLARGIEKIEGFVKNNQFGPGKQGRNNAYFLSVTCAEIPDQLLLIKYFAVCKRNKR